LYRLTLLGGVLLDGPDGPVGGRASQQRRLALLAYVGSAGDKGRSRDRLISFLWPETEAHQARRHLSHSLYILRSALGDEALQMVGDYLRSDPSRLQVDVRTFEDSLACGDLRSAVAAYAGPFMDGFFISGAPEFEHWVDSERRRLGSLYAHSLEQLARDSDTQGDHSTSAKWWGRLVAHDPYNSAAVVHLMEAFASAGDPANAIQYAEDHIRLLGEQFGMGPPEEVVAKIGELKRPTRRRDSDLIRSGVPEEGESDLGVGGAPGASGRAATGARWLARHTVLVSVAAVAGLAVLWSTFSSPRPGVDFVPNAVMVRAVENLTGDSTLNDVGRYAAYSLAGGCDRAGRPDGRCGPDPRDGTPDAGGTRGGELFPQEVGFTALRSAPD